MSDNAGYVQRARDLAPMLREAENEIETQRELPQHVVTALIDGGFFPSSGAMNPALTIAAQALRVVAESGVAA